MRRNMSRNLGLYKYLWPGSVYKIKTRLLYSKLPLYRSPRDPLNYFDITGLRYKEFDISEINFQTDLGFRYKHINQRGNTKLI